MPQVKLFSIPGCVFASVAAQMDAGSAIPIIKKKTVLPHKADLTFSIHDEDI